MAEYYDEFKKEFRKKNKNKHKVKEINKALKLHYDNPTLARRLASLCKYKVKFNLPSENPWYDVMKEKGITEKEVIIVKSYIDYKDKKEEERKRKFFANNEHIGTVSANYVSLSNKRINLKSSGGI